MCLTAQTNVMPCVAQKDIKVVKLLKRQEDGSYVTPFQDVAVTLNSTLCAEGDCTISTYECNEWKKEITSGFVHAKLRIQQNDKGDNIVGVVAYIPKGTEYFVDIYVSEVCAKQLFVTDEIVNLDTFSLTRDEIADVAKPFIDELIPSDKVTPGWLFTTEKQFVHPSDYKKNTNVIGVVEATDNNGKPSTVLALDEKEFTWGGGTKYCGEYKTKGTKKGDWALPNKEVLQNAFEKHITQINLALAVIGKETLNGYLYWASAEYSSNGAWLCHTSSALLYNYAKWFSTYVRPSFAIDV